MTIKVSSIETNKQIPSAATPNKMRLSIVFLNVAIVDQLIFSCAFPLRSKNQKEEQELVISDYKLLEVIGDPPSFSAIQDVSAASSGDTTLDVFNTRNTDWNVVQEELQKTGNEEKETIHNISYLFKNKETNRILQESV